MDMLMKQNFTTLIIHEVRLNHILPDNQVMRHSIVHYNGIATWLLKLYVTLKNITINILTDLAFVLLSSRVDFTFGDEKKDLNKPKSRRTEVHS